ncbi:MAG: hypothetical protein QOC82_1343 [Frankiaceae bacterium]|jgi:hypothetical protein|nr:hypothetical protein [Frankiaceae bacterium]
MTIDLEHELTAAMRTATADIVAPVDLLDRVRPRRRRVGAPGRSFLLAAGAATVAAVTIVVGLNVVGAGAPDHASRLTTAEAYADWGPTRGDLADDASLRASLVDEWEHSIGRNGDVAAFDPVTGDRPLQVLWMGTTPDGPAAYAVQHTAAPGQSWVYGVFLPDAQGQPRLYYRMTLDPDPTGSPWQPGPDVFSFASSRTPHAVVVVPTDPNAAVEVSTGHATDADGRVVPRWHDVVPVDGAAVVPLSDPASVFDTVVQISRDDRVVADSGVQLIATDYHKSLPANGFGLWCNACIVTHSNRELGTAVTPWTVWTERHAPSWYPTMQSQWTVGDDFGNGRELIAVQLWLPGEPAHTVVGVLNATGKLDEVLSDEVTDATARPLFAVRLPDARGWFVGSGPGAVFTGWRVPGGQWTEMVNARAALIPDAPAIELRLVVGGQERVFSTQS